MSIFTSIFSDLREKRLWPLAVALVAALIAIPVFVSNGGSASPTGSPTATPSTDAGSSATVPGVVAEPAPSQHRLPAGHHNPFAQQVQARSAAGSQTSPGSAAAKSTGTSPSPARSSAASTSTTPSTASSTASSTPTTSTPTASTTPSQTIVPKVPTVKSPAPTGLSRTESYDVTVSMTNSTGGIGSAHPARLSMLPSAREPFLIELGVLHGTHRVVFTVQPGTEVSGPGRCVPGPLDCEIVSLASGQVEDVLGRSPTGALEASQIAVTGIDVTRHRSAAAADQARRSVSAAGSQVLNRSALSALPLFHYDARNGTVVDLRNLRIGAS